jgi:hypothetical protein
MYRKHLRPKGDVKTMATVEQRPQIAPDEFAFHFETEVGVDADALANFLKRTASAARRIGGEVRVVGLQQGSLTVILKALKKGAAKEFKEKPIDTTIKSTAFVTAVVTAIVHLMSPQLSGDNPLAKAGADIVENHQVSQITIVTNDQNTVVMNPMMAIAVREAAKHKSLMKDHQGLLAVDSPYALLSPPVAELVRDAQRGELEGMTSVVEGELHFRPIGYRYWVPIEDHRVDGSATLQPGGRYRVSGHIELNERLPDRIVIKQAIVIPEWPK